MNVSVIIPLYNKEKYVRRAVDSVLAQTYTGFELIVVNDGSTDNSVSVVSKYNDSRLRLVSQDNKGVSAARNTGIREAKGSFIAFLDADDEWYPDFLSVTMETFNLYPEAGAAVTLFETEQGSKGLIGSDADEVELRILSVIDCFRESLNAKPSVIRRDVFKEVGCFNENLQIGEDGDMWNRIYLKYPIAKCPKICMMYYNSPEVAGTANKIPFGDEPFASTVMAYVNDLSADEKSVVMEWIYSSRLRTYTLGTYLAGMRLKANYIVRQCSETREHRLLYYFMYVLTLLPLPLGTLVYRMWRSNWKPLVFMPVVRPKKQHELDAERILQ